MLSQGKFHEVFGELPRDGQELDIQRGLELFNSLKNETNFSVEVLRGGQSLTLEYEIR